jgi:septum formation protein
VGIVRQLVLASASPRRAELLEQLGIPFRAVPSHCTEVAAGDLPPDGLALARARQKAEQVAASCSGSLVLGADTVVSCDGEILDKPGDARSAAALLARLSGRRHQVHTGIVLIDTATGIRRESAVCTAVTFRQLSQSEIAGYVATGEPFDKAGGYGIQGIGALLVEKIDGCYYNVVGLPLTRLGEMLKTYGVDLLCLRAITD